MSKSYNGWSASDDPKSIGITKFRVPVEDAEIFLTCRQELVPLFACLAADFHREVCPLDNKTKDDWGYAYRAPRGADFDQNALSCHASGTAIDLNASMFPRGLSRMNDRQKAAARRIEARYQIVTWGGDWHGEYIDEMHFEISRGVTKAKVQAVIKKLGLTAKGKLDLNVPQKDGAKPVLKPRLRKALEEGDRGEQVVYLQKALARHGYEVGPADGRFGSLTRKAVRQFQQKHGFRPDGIVHGYVWEVL